ncbi:MAG: gamma-glutamyltransferase [Thiogranum sp.]|jgi:gamma-glutamyltranspeptidase/glutathione hydrolase
MNSPSLGAVAAGHPETVEAAVRILRAGGNAFDAVVAAHWSACIAEPVLTSLGGGGFLFAQPVGRDNCLYDFFTHTPRHRRQAQEVDFHPIRADFGTTIQEFHIGYGSVATPGTVRGLFEIQRELCSLPMPVLIEPAIDLARRGVRINPLQAYIFDVIKPIYLATPQAARQFESRKRPGCLVGDGETLRLLALADTLEALGREGDRLFYNGDIATGIDAACRSLGGYLTKDDLESYRVIKRKPLTIAYRNAMLHTNPPPSSGGLLIGFALKLLERLAGDGLDIHSRAGIGTLADTMQHTNEARLEGLSTDNFDHRLLEPAYVQAYVERIQGRARSSRGTTHISIIDAAGNLAALSTSNGEGCGHILDDTGIMLNNMLGEEDLSPHGFQRWHENQRLTSMMSPGMLQTFDGTRIALGSGGSNRIRSAILQVVSAILDNGLSLEAAIRRPRIHFENGVLNTEAGFDDPLREALAAHFPQLKCWPDLNLYFGGVHAVAHGPAGFDCYGDPRRGGVAAQVQG